MIPSHSTRSSFPVPDSISFEPKTSSSGSRRGRRRRHSSRMKQETRKSKSPRRSSLTEIARESIQHCQTPPKNDNNISLKGTSSLYTAPANLESAKPRKAAHKLSGKIPQLSSAERKQVCSLQELALKIMPPVTMKEDVEEDDLTWITDKTKHTYEGSSRSGLSMSTSDFNLIFPARQPTALNPPLLQLPDDEIPLSD